MKCFCASTRRAARVLTRFYEENLSPADLTPAQFELLGTILNHPDWKQTEIAEDLSLDQTTLSRNLTVLLERKWVRRVLSSKDRRQSTYALSAQGRAAWEKALPHWRRAQEAMEERLGGDWQAFFAAVDRLSTVVGGEQSS